MPAAYSLQMVHNKWPDTLGPINMVWSQLVGFDHNSK